MARSLNRAQLIGNLTRDPELRYTPQGTAVCSFGLATNRSWTTDTGEKRDEAEFHKIVAWNKLAEICSQQKQTTEIIISDMIILDSMGVRPAGGAADKTKEDIQVSEPEKDTEKKEKKGKKTDVKEDVKEPSAPSSEDEVAPDDIPF